MAITARSLYITYRQRITAIISIVKTDKEAAIPAIIAAITTDIVPSLMTDLGRVKSLSGSEKRDLIIETIDYSIDQVFEELNKIPELKEASWDETLHSFLEVLLPPIIKLLISVENNELKFNKKFSKCVGCCGK